MSGTANEGQRGIDEEHVAEDACQDTGVWHELGYHDACERTDRLRLGKDHGDLDPPDAGILVSCRNGGDDLARREAKRTKARSPIQPP
jgi:hypothetical protein